MRFQFYLVIASLTLFATTPMQQTRCTLLHLDAIIPSRWIVGRQRIARLTLQNTSNADFSDVRLIVDWPALGEDETLVTGPITLERNTIGNIELPLKPVLADEHMLRLSLQCDLGGFLKTTVVTDSLHLKIAPVPQTQSELKVIVGDTIVQDKAFFGQMQTDAAANQVGHHINIQHGTQDQQIEQWLHDDPTLLQAPRMLELFIEATTCRDWQNFSGIELVGIQSGRFDMGRSEGDNEAQDDERQRKDVQLPHGFWMSRTPITQAHYERVMGALPLMKFESFRKPNHPVVNVTWDESVAFCEALNCTEHSARALPPGYAYRLPTEAEWEYACRAGSAAPRYNELRNVGATTASGGIFGDVARYEANAWGLHDLLGLVFEWCADVYGPYQPFRLVAPLRTSLDGDAPLERVLRGGCYQGPDLFARASARAARPPTEASSRIGFRVVLARE